MLFNTNISFIKTKLIFMATIDFEFRNQIYSAGYSIMNNISEGFGRESDKEFKRFLDYSKGSSWEVKNMYYIAEDLKYLNSETANIRREACEHEKNSIAKLMNHLKSKIK